MKIWYKHNIIHKNTGKNKHGRKGISPQIDKKEHVTRGFV
jgi:hypothetical protein